VEVEACLKKKSCEFHWITLPRTARVSRVWNFHWNNYNFGGSRVDARIAQVGQSSWILHSFIYSLLLNQTMQLSPAFFPFFSIIVVVLGSLCSAFTTMEDSIPLINLPSGVTDDSAAMKEGAKRVAEALQTSGFLLVKSDLLPLELQRKAIQVAENILNDGGNQSTIDHPTDPKKYIMLESFEEIAKLNAHDEQQNVLKSYWDALEQVKHQVLNCISMGLGLPTEYFMDFHRNNNSCLRLLHYPASQESTNKSSSIDDDDKTPTIRCKPHSDYGSVTLLSTDGVGGLQALIQDKWADVPYVEGALVVNIGSLLSDWTNGKLLATLHRVVSVNDSCQPRTSVAFFADPDENVSASLQGKKPTSEAGRNESDMTVAEYIKWRSGGVDHKRNGLALTSAEAKRAKKGDVEQSKEKF
jgi:isopenicillin N synthase-like dioxygenase